MHPTEFADSKLHFFIKLILYLQISSSCVMSADHTEILEGIRSKIRTVKDRLDAQVDENRRLREHNEDLRQMVQEKQVMIEELEEKNQQLTLAKSLLADGESAQDARIKINRIVREIDKCIALLNK